MKKAIILLLTATAVHADNLKLAWDASPSTNNGPLTYRLYAHTNTLASATNLAGATVKVAVGTNLTATVSNIVAGTWYFVATATATNGLESLPSNQLIVGVPLVSPDKLRTMSLQWSGEIAGTNWLDVLFFKIKVP